MSTHRPQSSDFPHCGWHHNYNSSLVPSPSQPCIAASLIGLGCQVELHMPILVLLQLILDKQGCIRPQTQLHTAAEWSGFCKVDQVPQCKRCCHRLVNGK